jgi:hypothetical protein
MATKKKPAPARKPAPRKPAPRKPRNRDVGTRPTLASYRDPVANVPTVGPGLNLRRASDRACIVDRGASGCSDAAPPPPQGSVALELLILGDRVNGAHVVLDRLVDCLQPVLGPHAPAIEQAEGSETLCPAAAEIRQSRASLDDLIGRIARLIDRVGL